MNKNNNVGYGCCNCSTGPPPTPPCNIVITIIDCSTGGPLCGASVTGTVTSTTTEESVDFHPDRPFLAGASETTTATTGTGTGETGCGTYTLGPYSSFPVSITVSYGGCSYTISATNCSPILLCYCTATLTIITSSGTVTGAPTGPGWTGPGGGPGTYTYCAIGPCGGTSSTCAPGFWNIQAAGDGYLTACTYVDIGCGQNLTVHLSPTYYANCYFDGCFASGPMGAETGECGCYLCNPGSPSGLAPPLHGGGLLPFNIEVKFNTLGAHVSIFEDDEEVWIPMGISSDAVTEGPFGPTRTTTWSVCQGGRGNFLGSPGGLNSVAAGGCKQFFSSTLPSVSVFNSYFGGSGIAIGYGYFMGAGCVLSKQVPCNLPGSPPISLDQQVGDPGGYGAFGFCSLVGNPGAVYGPFFLDTPYGPLTAQGEIRIPDCGGPGGAEPGTDSLRSPTVQRPSMAKMALSYLTSTAKHLANGAVAARPETQVARKAICDACPLLDAASNSCKVCGCGLDAKRARPKDMCPLRHWLQEDEQANPEPLA